MKKTILFLLLFVVSALPVSYAQSAEEYFLQAQKSYQASNYTQAIELYSEAIKLEPLTKYYKNRSFAYFKNNQYSLALVDYNKVIEAYPSADNYIDRAMIYLSLKKFDLALADLTKSIELAPSSPTAYYIRASMYCYDINQPEKAISDMNKAIELNPKARYYNLRGLIYKAQKKYELALADINKAIEMTPKDANLYDDRARLYFFNFNQLEKALTDMNKAVELKGTTNHYRLRGQIAEDLKKYDLALADYNKAIQLDSTLATNYFFRGCFYREQAQYSNALRDLTKAIEINPKADYYQSRGLTYSKMSNPLQAINDFSSALAKEPKDKFLLYARAIEYYNITEFNKAIIDSTEALKIDPNYFQSHFLIATIYHSQGKTDLAIPHYHKVIELTKNNTNQTENLFLTNAKKRLAELKQ